MSSHRRIARSIRFALLVIAALSLHRPGLALSARVPLSPAEKDILARIDSLWEAEAGMAARDYIRSRIPGARAEADSLFLLNLLCREGRLCAALNRPLDAEPILRESMRLASATGESLIYRFSLHWLGVAHIARGQMDEVLSCFEELLRLSRQSGDKYHEGYAWMGLAYHDWQSDRPRDARDKYLCSARIFRVLGQDRGELWALVGLNNALTMLGEYDEAMAGHRRIIEMGGKSRSPSIEALGHNNLGVLLFSIGDTGEALDHFRRAAEIQGRIGNIRESIIAWQNASICEIIIGRTQEASKRLIGLLETSRENGYIDVQGGLLKELAYAHLQRGDCHLAAGMFRDALSLTDGLTPKRESEALIGLSSSLAGMDSTDAALELLRARANRMLSLEDPRMQFAFRNEMAARLLDENLPREAYDMAMTVERKSADLGLAAYRLQALPVAARAAMAIDEPDSALALLKRGVRLWEMDRSVPLDPEWREQRGAAAKQLFTELLWSILNHPPERPREARIRASFEILQSYKARTLLERMMGPGGERVPTLQAPALSLDTLQERILRQGDLFLDFAVGPERTVLFACTPRECRVLDLAGEKELSGKLRMFHELLSAPPAEEPAAADIEALEATARNLTSLLFGSCTDLIADAEHVIVAPDGALNLLPFSCLFPDRTISEVPAAAVLAWSRRGAHPDTTRSGSGNIRALRSGYTEHGATLRGAVREIKMLERRFAGVETGPAPALASAFAGFGIIHVAAHGTVDDQSPWRSAIHLGAGPDSIDAHTLRASEIAGWRLPARLVVLSSCRSARGRILSGEGVQGLAAAFISAGAPSVLATLWSIDDEVTAEFMSYLYDGLQRGESVSSSVKAAQERIRRRSRTAHPFYWAGFVLVGDGAVRVSLVPYRETRRLWWTAALVPIIIVLTLAAGRKKISSPR